MGRAAREVFWVNATNLAPVGVPPRCPPRTTPGRPGGQLATHATHTPVIDGAGHAFAMRRSGVRIPAAPPQRSACDLQKCARGFAGRGLCLTIAPPGLTLRASPRNTCNRARGSEKVAHRWARRRSASGPTLNRNRQVPCRGWTLPLSRRCDPASLWAEARWSAARARRCGGLGRVSGFSWPGDTPMGRRC